MFSFATQVVRRTKIITQRREVPVSVELRRESWRPFGQAVKQEDGITYASFEEVKIEKPDVPQKSQLEVLQDTATSVVVCRRCGGPHWTLSCPYKDVQQAQAAAAAGGGGGGGAGGGAAGGAAGAAAGGGGGPGMAKAGAAGGGTGKYVVPGQRGAAAEGEGPREVPLEELTQLRVSNLSDEVEEEDLHQLFRPFGHVDKIFLARDRNTGAPRGFAFVRYLRHDEAAVALKSLDGLPFMVSEGRKDGREGILDGDYLVCGS